MDVANQVLHRLVVIRTLEAEVLAEFSVAALRVRIGVLREGAHLRGNLRAVVADDQLNQQRVGDAVRQVMERAQLVRHGVAHAQKCVGERHASHRGGVAHLFAGNRLVLTVVVARGQILENQLSRLLRQTVGEVRRHHGGVGFQRVGQRVDTRGGGQALRRGHHHVSIHNRHLRQQFVVRQRVLHAGVLIGNDGERSDFGARASRGWDGDEVRLFTHLREGVHALADIHEAHCHVEEVHFRMLVHDPHNLAGVHCGTAADGDNAVRLEGGHGLCAFLRAGEGRVGRNIVERGVDDAQLIQLVGNRLGEAGFEQERVGDDEAALLAHNCLEFIQGDRQAALLEVDLFRRTEPQHILPPDGNSLDVQQVLDADVLGDGVAAPRAAAQRQRRTQHEVVQVADAALRGRRVDENTAGLHGSRMFCHFLFLVYIDI